MQGFPFVILSSFSQFQAKIQDLPLSNFSPFWTKLFHLFIYGYSCTNKDIKSLSFSFFFIFYRPRNPDGQCNIFTRSSCHPQNRCCNLYGVWIQLQAYIIGMDHKGYDCVVSCSHFLLCGELLALSLALEISRTSLCVGFLAHPFCYGGKLLTLSFVW